MRRMGIPAVLLLILGGCEQILPKQAEQVDPNAAIIAVARTAVMDELKDPESARFREVSLFRGLAKDVLLRRPKNDKTERVLFCGEVNGRTPMGGYSGYKPFSVVLDRSSNAAEETFIVNPDGDVIERADAAIVAIRCMAKPKQPVVFELGPYAGSAAQ